MKKIYSFLILILCSIFSVNAQRNLEVLIKSEFRFNLITADIDSITFNLSNDSLMLLFQAGVTEGYGINFNRIDTLKFNNDSLILDDPMDGEFESQIAQLSDTLLPTIDLFYEDGQSIYEFLQETDPAWLENPPYLRNSIVIDASSLTAMQQKKLFLGRMFDIANNLVTRSNHSNSLQPNGLAYVFGGKHIQAPINPAGPINPNLETSCPPDPGCSNQSLRGLDCSGMLGLMAHLSGVPIMSGPSSAQSNAQNWNNVFNSNNSHKFSKLKYSFKNSIEVPPAFLRQGDIVCKPGHIGIILNNIYFSGSNSILMYQSNGQPRLCPTSSSSPCTNNTTTSRGPRTVMIGEPLFNQLFGSNYTVLRLDTIGGCAGGITSVTDIDGNEYPVVQIGSQCWFAENIKTSHFSDGSVIPNVTDDLVWNQLTTPAWCNYNNLASEDDVFGKIYNWETAIDSKNVCPSGFHVPTDDEWSILINYLDPNAGGGTLFPNLAGGKMKSLTGFSFPNLGATNESGFNALGGGARTVTGTYINLYSRGNWWSSTRIIEIINEEEYDTIYGRSLDYSNSSVLKSYNVLNIIGGNSYGGYIRCIAN
jgi:uncharacterized protein (TIGR02145 family)